MPTYDYRCEDCRKSFSVSRTWVEYDRQRTPKCPKCGRSKAVQQVYGGVLVKTAKKS